jgi:hypothetical protein
MVDPQIHTPTSSVLKYIVFAAMKLLKIQYKLKKEKKKPFRISEVKICFISLCILCMPYISNDLIALSETQEQMDQLGIGSVIILDQQQDENICPCNLLKIYLKGRPSVQGPLFCHLDGKSLTRYQFVSILKKALNWACISDTGFSSHSFRIGAATSLAMEGVDKGNTWEPQGFDMNHSRPPCKSLRNKLLPKLVTCTPSSSNKNQLRINSGCLMYPTPHLFENKLSNRII